MLNRKPQNHCADEAPWEWLPEIQPTPKLTERVPSLGKSRRFAILKRDGFKCLYCGRSPAEDGIRLQVDHIIPRSKGGGDHDDNLVSACEDCNQGKKAMRSGSPKYRRKVHLISDSQAALIWRLEGVQFNSLMRDERRSVLLDVYASVDMELYV